MRQVWVTLRTVELNGKRNEANTPPHTMGVVANRGPMVCTQPELELWQKLKTILTHEPGADPVIAGELLD
jgi:hypothetical protein